MILCHKFLFEVIKMKSRFFALVLALLIVISNYPVDIHSKEKNQSTLEIVYKDYQLPIESLKVKGWDNLYVIGRCISAEEKALGALRIIPSCFSMGEGLAKYLIESE